MNVNKTYPRTFIYLSLTLPQIKVENKAKYLLFFYFASQPIIIEASTMDKLRIHNNIRTTRQYYKFTLAPFIVFSDRQIMQASFIWLVRFGEEKRGVNGCVHLIYVFVQAIFIFENSVRTAQYPIPIFHSQDVNQSQFVTPPPPLFKAPVP